MKHELEPKLPSSHGQESGGEVPLLDRVFFGYHLPDDETPVAREICEAPAGNEITDLQAKKL